jgi:hypothetical protein
MAATCDARFQVLDWITAGPKPRIYAQISIVEERWGGYIQDYVGFKTCVLDLMPGPSIAVLDVLQRPALRACIGKGPDCVGLQHLGDVLYIRRTNSPLHFIYGWR